MSTHREIEEVLGMPRKSNEVDMEGARPCKATIEDLERNALEHYEKLANKSHEWLNTIPQAIKLYFKLRKFRENRGQRLKSNEVNREKK